MDLPVQAAAAPHAFAMQNGPGLMGHMAVSPCQPALPFGHHFWLYASTTHMQAQDSHAHL